MGQEMVTRTQSVEMRSKQSRLSLAWTGMWAAAAVGQPGLALGLEAAHPGAYHRRLVCQSRAVRAMEPVFREVCTSWRLASLLFMV